MNSVETHSAEETMEFGRSLAKTLPSRGLVLLIGNLGAGKTTLVKGIAEGLNAAPADDVTSPTFTLIHEYGEAPGGGPKLHHIDLYRLEEARQVAALGIDELLDGNTLVLIEWGERFPNLWPPHVEIHITRTGFDTRTITIQIPMHGAMHQTMLP
jgi:tRNA threonylcarbamoyladenosine biosynthesis protein TsaE